MDFRLHLLSELKGRQSKNPSYSVRAFARDLGISHSLLLRYFNETRRLSLSQTVRISKKLNLSMQDTTQFILDDIRKEVTTLFSELDDISS